MYNSRIMLGAIALDATARTIDTDGRMHINRSHISKVGVNPYYGREIPGAIGLGLDPDRIYYMLRPADELEKAAHTFARNPILNKHIPVNSADPQTEYIVGAIGSDVQFNDPYLDADLCFWDDKAIAGIETDTLRELSAAYHYLPVMIAGEFQGQKYDGIMTQIRGNHLATVEAGRAGSDVLAADEDIKIMKTTKLGKLLIATLGTAFPKLAMDSKFKPLLAEAKKADKADIRAKLLAMDADTPSEQLDGVMDAVMDDEEDPKPKVAKDSDEESEEDKKKRLDAEKAAKDAECEADKGKKAMDSAIATVTQSLREADEARRLVRPVVGEVVAQDSASDIYGFALDHMKVDRTGVTGIPALRALFNLANKPTAAAPAHVAMDSAALTTMFPGATRFRRAF